MSPKYSIIIPVYNRPGEVEELLASLCKQTYTNFEVVLVEDGSSVTSQPVYEKYSSLLSIQYFFKPNSGPGPSRNFGFTQAKGEYFVVFDSDCVIPPEYLFVVERHLAKEHLDVWGGPDRGHGDFTLLQQAMAYSMSSVLTTGGIRGGKKRVGSFQPRSFNMGMSRNAYDKTGGFKFDRFAEDIEFSLRAVRLGLKVGLIAEAFVYHKRRATLDQFFRQVSNGVPVRPLPDSSCRIFSSMAFVVDAHRVRDLLARSICACVANDRQLPGSDVVGAFSNRSDGRLWVGVPEGDVLEFPDFTLSFF